MSSERFGSNQDNHGEGGTIGKEWQNMDAKMQPDAESDNGERYKDTGEVKVRLLNQETDDLSRAANLLFQVDPYICPDFFGDEERAERMSGILFGEEGGLFDPQHILVAEQDGKIVGVLVFADNQVKPWNSTDLKTKLKEVDVELPEYFDRANERYMEPVVEGARNLPDGVVEIEFCATDREIRGKGIGTKMFSEFLGQKRYQEQHLTVLADNPAAIHLYEKMGFRIVSTQTGYPDEHVITHNMIRRNDEVENA